MTFIIAAVSMERSTHYLSDKIEFLSIVDVLHSGEYDIMMLLSTTMCSFHLHG